MGETPSSNKLAARTRVPRMQVRAAPVRGVRLVEGDTMTPAHVGEDGKLAWFRIGGRWVPGTALSVDESGMVEGICRDWGDLSQPYPSSPPTETEGSWPASEVRWERPV